MPVLFKENNKNKTSSLREALKLQMRDGQTSIKNRIKGTGLKWNSYLKPGLRKFQAYSIIVDIDSKAVSTLHNLSTISGGIGVTKIRPSDSVKDENRFLQEIISPIYLRVPYVENLKSLHPSKPDPLDYYIEKGGNCITKSLMTIAVLQRYREDGTISGSFGLRYNFTNGAEIGHAWVVYKDANGSTIVDPTQGILVKVGDRKTNEAVASVLLQRGLWNYFDVEQKRETLTQNTIFNAVAMTYGFLGTYLMHARDLGIFMAFALANQVSSTIKYKRHAKRQIG